MTIKTLFLIGVGVIMSLDTEGQRMVTGNSRTDSVYLFSYSTLKNKGKNGLHFAYSEDGKRWTSIANEYGFVKSDYGSWGDQKRMLDPVLERTREGKWICSWRVNEKDAVLAHTSTDDLILWKPQDYLADNFKIGPNRNIERTKVTITLTGEEVEGQMHRVERSLVDGLINYTIKHNYLESLYNEEAKDDAVRFANLKGIDVTLSTTGEEKKISEDLFGIFFEDINYAADGGLYGEMVQNRDFEYCEEDRARVKGWGHSYGWEADGVKMQIDTLEPLHRNNKHYAVLEGSGKVKNIGWDGFTFKGGEQYNFSVYGKLPKGVKSGGLTVSLCTKDGEVAAKADVAIKGNEWKQVRAKLKVKSDVKDGYMQVELKGGNAVCVDFVSLFPQNTFKGRENGMRADLAQALADLKPRFVRFPGGCVSHGNGLHNIYRWKNTIGKLYERVGMRNIWAYRQSMGLGYYEYFQFCEDIGAKPLPVIAAGVPCQNSSVGGHGQQGGIPLDQMEEYIQDILDLIEWANGPVTSKWGKKRAEAGHPKPFNLQYLGIGNEDLISDVFVERFEMIFNAIREKHPEITVIGTVGPFYEGSDYEYGWKLANEMNIPIVDEHYYCKPGWFIYNQGFYDGYKREGTKVYLGEYASHLPRRNNNIESALSIALYLTGVEKNADVVTLSSYAPLLARRGRTQWRPDMIYFDNNNINLSTDYYVQKLFGQNAGGVYVESVLRTNTTNPAANVRVAASVVKDAVTGEVIVKVVNMLPCVANVDLSKVEKGEFGEVIVESLTGERFDATPVIETEKIAQCDNVELKPYSMKVIRYRQKVTK